MIMKIEEYSLMMMMVMMIMKNGEYSRSPIISITSAITYDLHHLLYYLSSPSPPLSSIISITSSIIYHLHHLLYYLSSPSPPLSLIISITSSITYHLHHLRYHLSSPSPPLSPILFPEKMLKLWNKLAIEQGFLNGLYIIR